MADKVFAEWVIIKEIETKYWSIKKLSIKVEEFKSFLDTYDANGRVNLDMQKGKAGKYYMALNTWQPDWKKKESIDTTTANISVENIPF